MINKYITSSITGVLSIYCSCYLAVKIETNTLKLFEKYQSRKN